MMRTILRHAAPLLGVLPLAGCGKDPWRGDAMDEARRAGRVAASFPHANEDYLHDIAEGVALTLGEARGRNMWFAWRGGNDRFRNGFSAYTFGAFDLLKIISSHPSPGYSRDNRRACLGLVNEPLFRNAQGAGRGAPRPVAGRALQG